MPKLRCASLVRGLVWVGLLCVASCARHLASLQAKTGESKEFNYFLLVRQWPGSYCSKHECPFLQDRGFHLTIHGLWPNYDDGTWPQFCDPDQKFNEDELTDLLDSMRTQWPSTFMDSNEALWEHEWLKHGTCAEDLLPNEYSYFDATLTLHNQYPLADPLRAAGIVPSKDTVYRTQDLVDAIANVHGLRSIVHCDEEGQLSEIWMCFDRNLQPFDCDLSYETSTCDLLTIPPLSELSSEAGYTGKFDNNDGMAIRDSGRGNHLNAGVSYDSGISDSIYGLLEALTAPASDDDVPADVTSGAIQGATAAALDEGAQASASASTTGDQSRTQDTTFTNSNGNALNAVDTFDDHAYILEMQKQQMDIQAIELRLMETETQMAAESSAKADALDTVVPAADDHRDGYSGAVVALTASTERSIVQIWQQLRAIVYGSAHRADNAAVTDSNVGDGDGDGDVMPRPNGGAAAAASVGAHHFVWTSKLRQGTETLLAFDDDEAEERAAIGSGDGGGSSVESSDSGTLTVVTDRGNVGAALWTVRGVVIPPDTFRQPAMSVTRKTTTGFNVGLSPSPPMWVILLLALLTVLVVLTLSLVVIGGMALVGAKWGPQDHRRMPVDQLDLDLDPDLIQGAMTETEEGCWCEDLRPEEKQMGSLRGARKIQQQEDGLVEPLLSYNSCDDSDDDGDDAMAASAPPKIYHASRSSSANGDEDFGNEAHGEERVLEQLQQRQGALQGHANTVQAEMWSGTVLLLPTMARSAKNKQEQQQQHPTASSHAPVE